MKTRARDESKTSCVQCTYSKCIEQSCICIQYMQHMECRICFSGTVSFVVNIEEKEEIKSIQKWMI